MAWPMTRSATSGRTPARHIRIRAVLRRSCNCQCGMLQSGIEFSLGLRESVECPHPAAGEDIGIVAQARLARMMATATSGSTSAPPVPFSRLVSRERSTRRRPKRPPTAWPRPSRAAARSAAASRTIAPKRAVALGCLPDRPDFVVVKDAGALAGRRIGAAHSARERRQVVVVASSHANLQMPRTMAST